MTSQSAFTVVEYVDMANSILHFASADMAFRRFNWLTGSPILNRAGDLRGMVLNAKARTAFGVTGKISAVTSAAATVQLVLEVAEEAARSWPQIEEIVASNASPAQTLARLSAQASGICSRVLVKTGTGSVNAVTSVMRFTRHINPVWHAAELMKPFTGGVNRSDEAMDQMDAWMAYIENAADYAYDGKRFYSFIVAATTKR